MPPDVPAATAPGPDALDVRIRIRAAREGDFDLDVAFHAPPGVTILFGPSGSGKSTTLGVIAGLRRAHEGRVALGGEVWFDAATGVARAIHERGVSLVFQSLALFPHMSARHNVEYGIARHVPRAERRVRAMAMLERMRVAHLAERRPRTFSGGEAQRVALARAFARDPKVVLLDEAFSALDRDLRRELLADVRAHVTERKIPTIMVTHHRMEAVAMGDRMVLMGGGRVLGVGQVNELLREEAALVASREEALDDLDRTPMPILHFKGGGA
jgi:molybdate transport system ATP-binding protein